MIKLSKPHIPDTAFDKIKEVLSSGNLVQGKFVLEFEDSLKKYLNSGNAIVVSSGTAALHLALISLNIKKGDEVIVPAFTFPATANVVEMVGARPVFIDIRLDDFCIDTNQIEKKITKKTKAIIPVHEFGQSAEMDKIVDIATRHNLFIIEDAACALGTEFHNKKAGTFGHLGCFSFHPRKAITTGEGGVIVTDNNELAEKIRSLRNHGIQYKNGKTDFVFAGLNYRMTDFQAALGVVQLQEIDKIIDERIGQAQIYNQYLSEINWIKPPCIFSGRKMIFQTYHILIDNSMDRNQLMILLKRKGIEVNYGAYALNKLSYFNQKYSFNENEFPNAVLAFLQGIALPIGHHLDIKSQKKVFNVLNGFSR